MEQIVLYLAVLTALSGFGMGLMNLLGPLLKRRNINLPSLDLTAFLRRDGHDEAEDYDLDDEDDLNAARDFAEASFAPDVSLLKRRAVANDDDELDEELAGVLDSVAESVEADDGDSLEEHDDDPVVYTVAASSTSDDDDAEFEDEETEGDDEELDDEELDDEELDDEELDDEELDDEEDDDEEEDEDEPEESKPAVQVVAGGGGDDMLSFFGESADDAVKAHHAWREDLPDVTIEELLADARSLNQEIRGKKRPAA